MTSRSNRPPKKKASDPPKRGQPDVRTEVRVKPGVRPGAEVYEIEYESEPPQQRETPQQAIQPRETLPTQPPKAGPALGRKPTDPYERAAPTAETNRPPRRDALSQGRQATTVKIPPEQIPRDAPPSGKKTPAQGVRAPQMRGTSLGLGVPGPSFGGDTELDPMKESSNVAPTTRRQEADRGDLDLGLSLGDDPDSNDALDLVGRVPVSSIVPPTATAKADPLGELRERYALGDFSGALTIAEGVLEDDPKNTDAQRYAESCRDVLRQMYAARLGPLDQIPVVAIPVEQLRWLTLDHRAGFLLSHVDGVSTLEEILDISGMPPLEAMRIIHDLLQQKVIALQ